MNSIHSRMRVVKRLKYGRRGSKLQCINPKDVLSQVWLKLALCFWRKMFLKVINLFSFLYLFSEFESLKYKCLGGPLCIFSLFFPVKKMLECLTLHLIVWNWHNGTGEEEWNYFPWFTIISPWKKNVALYLKTLQFWERKIVKSFIKMTTTMTQFALDIKCLSKITLKLYSV